MALHGKSGNIYACVGNPVTAWYVVNLNGAGFGTIGVAGIRPRHMGLDVRSGGVSIPERWWVTPQGDVYCLERALGAIDVQTNMWVEAPIIAAPAAGQYGEIGGLYNWSLESVGEVSEITDFTHMGLVASDSWKRFLATNKTWTATAESYWTNENWWDYAITKVARFFRFYFDKLTLPRSLEGFGFTSISGNQPTGELITEAINIQGTDLITYGS